MADEFDYKKALNMLMAAMVIHTLSPIESGGGSPDLCISCMQNGYNIIYGPNGEGKLVCDHCPKNFMNYTRKEK